MSLIIDLFLPAFVYFIVAIKVVFVITSLAHIYFSKIKPDATRQETSKKRKEIIEFLFVAAMAVLLILIFNPWMDNLRHLNSETRLLFYLFGWILIITAKWDAFFSLVFEEHK